MVRGEYYISRTKSPCPLGKAGALQLPSGVVGTIADCTVRENLIAKVLDFVQLGGPQRTLPAGLYAPRLGRLSNLTRLNLSNSCLYGDIPPELRRLTKLTVLDLSVHFHRLMGQNRWTTTHLGQ